MKQTSSLSFKYQNTMLVPDSYVAKGYAQLSLHQLHKHDAQRYVPFIEYAKVNKSIDIFVAQVNETANKQG